MIYNLLNHITETYWVGDELWENHDDYPAGSSIYNAPVVNYGDYATFIVFGGYQSGYGEMEDIVKFSRGSWQVIGYLNNERRG